MSCSSLNDVDFRHMKTNFVRWAAAWATQDANLEPPKIDLPSLVNLMKIMGYQIVHTDMCDPPEALRRDENGSRMIITCSHSGQRFIMEHVTEQCSCKRRASVDTQESCWQVTGRSPTRGMHSDLIPSISKEQQAIVKNVMSYIIKFLTDQNYNGSNDAHSTPKKAMGRYSEPVEPKLTTPVRILRKTVGTTLNPDETFSPARYRSLDTLTSKDADTGFPQPGALMSKAILPPKELTITHSSPNIKLEVPRCSNDDVFTKPKELNAKSIALIRCASEKLLKALDIINDNMVITPSPSKLSSASKGLKKLICSAKPPVSKSSLKYISNPNLSSKTGARITASVPVKKSTSTYSLAVKPQAGPSATSAAVKPNASKALPLVPKSHATQSLKKSEKYSHIKSTIPKLAERKTSN